MALVTGNVPTIISSTVLTKIPINLARPVYLMAGELDCPDRLADVQNICFGVGKQKYQGGGVTAATGGVAAVKRGVSLLVGPYL